MRPTSVLFALMAVAGLMVSQKAMSNSFAGEKITVEYRLTTWKTVEVKAPNKAETLVKTLQKLNCEVKQVKHGDHFDISYRCVEWNSIVFDSHKSAHAWEKWLKSIGFEAKHEH